MKVNLVLGTMTFGQQAFLEEAAEMVKCFLDKGYNELDTAYVYNEGQSEIIIGQIIKKFGRDKIKIATKVNPRISGRLDREAVYKQLPESLERMDIEKVDIFYLHFPDQTPVEMLEACNELYQKECLTIGLSNFQPDGRCCLHKCKSMVGFVMCLRLYNPLSRKAEIII